MTLLTAMIIKDTHLGYNLLSPSKKYHKSKKDLKVSQYQI